MRQEQRRHEEAEPGQRMLQREARDAANRWLARFAPLLEDTHALTADECRARLTLMHTLRAEAPGVLSALEARAENDDVPLVTTLQTAAGHLDSLETDLKRRLGALAPGDPEGIVDLDTLRAQLAEVAARRELGEAVGLSATSPRLELELYSGNWLSAGFLGIFSAGWLSFTTVHAFLVISGFTQAFGWGALGLLGFYGIFWAVGIAMAWGAVLAASSETLLLEGRELILRRRLGPWRRERKHTLGPDSRAFVAQAAPPASQSAGPSGTEIALADAEGREIRFGGNCSLPQQEQYVDRMNAYLGALRQ